MGYLTVVLSVFTVILIIGYTEAAGGSCPPVNKVFGCSPKCEKNNECKDGKLCCPNGCKTKSCVQPVGGGPGTIGDNKPSSGSGVNCDNVKCSPQEVCKEDSPTKRKKCVRT